VVEHFYVTFGDPSCIGLKDIVWKKTTGRQTDKRRWKPYPRDYCWRTWVKRIHFCTTPWYNVWSTG